MSIISNETFLPGVITEIESDYSFGYDSSQFGTTDSVLIIGTAFNGPVGVPVEVYSPEHGKYIFGKAYDSKTKQEATLIGGIEDAYQRGCRTIYAIRISGKQIEKDFDFALDTNLKFRVSGIYPSNQVKDFFMVYDDTDGDEKIKLYKPAEKATITEKMEGLVESDNSVLVTEIRINRDYGMTKDTKLTDLFRVVNEHRFNNVLRFSIVDDIGSDVTNTSFEAQNLPLGAMFPGAYLIGRDQSLCAVRTDIDYVLIGRNDQKPYPTFDDILFKKLAINTDVNANVPIYAKDSDQLKTILREVEIFMFKDYDFLETPGVADRAFEKDQMDYEEVKISDFEIYKRLGSGFATTARAERRVDSGGHELVPRIKEAPVNDVNRTLAITDGIYSMLENLNTRYRVLTCGNADGQISGRLPRPADFQIASPVSTGILGSLITVTPVVDADCKNSPKKYSFMIDKLPDPKTSSVSDIYTDTVLKVIPKINDKDELMNSNVPVGTFVMLVDSATGEGTLIKSTSKSQYEPVTDEIFEEDMFIIDGVIYEYGNAGKFVAAPQADFEGIGDDATYRGKNFVLAENDGKVYAFKVLEFGDKNVSPLGNIRTMLSENKDKTLIYAQSNHFEENQIIVRSAILDGITLEEFVELLNEDESLNKSFEFSVSSSGMTNKDDYVTDIAEASFGEVSTLDADRELSYDYTRYIPYKATDNFARQLAQHCTYTSLKTAPTHGIIGIGIVNDLRLNNIANKVDELITLELDLYAKNAQGRNMLDRNDLPYPIGKNISVVFSQYFVNMDDGYRFVSNGASGYAGMVSQLPLDQSSTNQPIAIGGTMFDLTNYQLTRLTQKGYITVKKSFTRGAVITDGITMAPAASSFRRLAATRIIGAVEELIREAVEPYIGKQNHAANRNSMQTAIRSNLDKLVGRLIEEYDFNMVVDPKVMKFSYIDIDYKIVPVYEIREVRNRISVRDEL